MRPGRTRDRGRVLPALLRRRLARCETPDRGMSTPRQHTRQRQQMETLCAATIRALCGEPQLRYRSHRLYNADTPVPGHAPHLRVADDDDLPAYRGAADGMALRLLYSNAAAHRQRAPDDPVARLMFDWLEQLRVES